MKKTYFFRSLALALSVVLLLSALGCGKKKGTAAGDASSAVTEREYAAALNLYLDVKNARSLAEKTKAEDQLTNGLLSGVIQEYYRILCCSASYLTEKTRECDQSVNENKDAYGEDYRFSCGVVTEEKADKAAVDAFQKELDLMLEGMQFSLEAMDGFDEAKWEEVGEIWKMSAQDAKAFRNVVEMAYAKLKTLQVTEGYWLDVRILATGSKLSEQKQVVSEEIYVYKVNGQWICADAIDCLWKLTEFNGY